MSVAYLPPGEKMDVDAINAMTKKMQRWEVFGYWKFFEREDSGKVVNDHVSLAPLQARSALAGDGRKEVKR